ncbi:MAG: EF-P lysine aminoacylase GenX [Deltaproteobacteria bacterium]|nr:MAG: EF-P lysine aminoacylase GenX [Deltaproteobacteria bacterium]
MTDFRLSAVKSRLNQRALIIRAVRDFFVNNGYLEVETPCRIPAPAPESHIDAQATGDWYLQTSPELCMKRLLSAGYPRIFQICKCFRQNERGRLHLPELTMLEWYTAKQDYRHMMKQCEDLLLYVALHAGNGRTIVYQGQSVDLAPPWIRMTVAEAFDRFASISLEKALQRNCFDDMIALEIEPHLGSRKPLFLYDYPACFASLARRKPGNPDVAERFELYIRGIELCNAFSELNDPREQRMRFEAEQEQRRASGKQSCPMPEKFLTSLSHMPPATGNALGIDRLIMLLTDAPDIEDVVAFTPETL